MSHSASGPGFVARLLLVTGFASAPMVAQDWRLVPTGVSPVASIGCGMTFDETLGQVLLFGGHSDGLAHDSTWAFNGTAWTMLNPPNRPPARGGTVMVYDSQRSRAVLFGGWDDFTRRNDVWEWNGTNWSAATPATGSPPGRDSHAAAFDRARGRTVIFGGRGTGGSGDIAFDDTWEWDGTTWTQGTSPTNPPGRWNACLAYDEARGRTVLFGGADSNGCFADTWTWDGNVWTQQQPAASPAPRGGPSMAYDAARRRVVLYGGNDSGSWPDDTWEWTGVTWEQVLQVSPPSPTWWASMAFDRLRSCTVLYGGITAPGSSNPASWLHDTWTYHTAPVAPGRFFLSMQPTTANPATLVEINTAGQVVATHDLASQLPAGTGTPGYSFFTPCEVTPWGTILCTTGYHNEGGWFDVDATGRVCSYYSDAGTNGTAHGPQRACVDPITHCVYGAHYAWFGGSSVRAFTRLGQPLWSTGVVEALATAVVGTQVYASCFQVNNITVLSSSGGVVGGFGPYRHVFVLKALPNQKLLIGHQPTDQGPTTWIVRDLVTSTESILNTSSHPLPNRRADVDDTGLVWIMCGSELVCFDPTTGTELGTIQIASGLPTMAEYGLAVSGSPLVPMASAVNFGTACMGTNGVPLLAPAPGSLPVLGQTLTALITNTPNSPFFQLCMPFLGFDNTQSSGIPLPRNLTPLGMPGCTQYADPFQVTFLFYTSPVATWTLAVPNVPSFAGVHVYLQAALIDQSANAMGLTATNALDATLGW